MAEFFFVLGRYYQLSLSEILSLFSRFSADFTLRLTSPEIAVFSLESDSLPGEIRKHLGGTVKIGRVLGKAGLNQSGENLFDFFRSPFLENNFIPKKSGKIHFGLSLYNAGADKEIFRKLEKNSKFFLSEIKANLENIGYKAGFLKIKERSVSSVSVVKNRLLDRGFELILIATHDKIIIGKTTSVQDFAGFTRRDMDRPKKDKAAGILPVKLARMMINLTGENISSLFDPFCGSGTILMEAVLLGINNLVGSDVDLKAISNTRINLDWLFDNFHLKREKFKISLRTADARHLNKSFTENKVDCIITEPFLGPPLHRPPPVSRIKNIFAGLTPLYRDSLISFKKIVKPDGKVIIIFPFFRSQGKEYYINSDIVRTAGFEMTLPTLTIKNLPKELLPQTRPTLKYFSPNQNLGREILILTPLKPR